jgi:hypothetical protein
MRANQREGVAWLRKAADSASLEVADDEDLMKEGKAVDLMELKARKAQFALSIYELGVSHMNGWGIEQDKVLALRCFEIAGCKFPTSSDHFLTFTDCNSMGRRRRSSRGRILLRSRSGLQEKSHEERQVLPPSRSQRYQYDWEQLVCHLSTTSLLLLTYPRIYKAKYSDETEGKKSSESRASPEKEKEKKPRNKSRTRNMFGRKKSTNS